MGDLRDQDSLGDHDSRDDQNGRHDQSNQPPSGRTPRASVQGVLPPAIHPATIGDLDEIMDVQRSAGRGTTARFRERTAEAIEDELRHVVTARLGDRCVGWAATQFFADADGSAPAGHYLMGVTVEPEHRRAGIARALIAARIAWIRQRADTVSYFANAANTASLAAHRDWPFEEIARGPVFHGVTFTGGVGVLLTARFDGSGHDSGRGSGHDGPPPSEATAGR